MHIDLSPLLISLATTFTATAATFVLGVLAARRLYGVRGSMRAWIDGILTLPLVLPPTVVGFFLLLLFGRRSPIGQALEHLGISIVFSWPATVIAATVLHLANLDAPLPRFTKETLPVPATRPTPAPGAPSGAAR